MKNRKLLYIIVRCIYGQLCRLQLKKNRCLMSFKARKLSLSLKPVFVIIAIRDNENFSIKQLDKNPTKKKFAAFKRF